MKELTLELEANFDHMCRAASAVNHLEMIRAKVPEIQSHLDGFGAIRIDEIICEWEMGYRE